MPRWTKPRHDEQPQIRLPPIGSHGTSSELESLAKNVQILFPDIHKVQPSSVPIVSPAARRTRENEFSLTLFRLTPIEQKRNIYPCRQPREFSHVRTAVPVRQQPLRAGLRSGNRDVRWQSAL